MKWGTRYSARYVHLLARSVRRHLRLPHRFLCLTDDATGIHADIETAPLPPFDPATGYIPEHGWPKLAMFAPGYCNLEGKVLFLDLDVIILDALDPLFDYTDSIAMVRDPINLYKRPPQPPRTHRGQPLVGQGPAPRPQPLGTRRLARQA